MIMRSRRHDEGGVAPQLCGLGSGRGRVRSLQCDLVIELVWYFVNCLRAKQVAAGSGGVLDSVGPCADDRLCALRRDTVLALRSSVLLEVGPSKMTARVRYPRSTTETERKPAQRANDE